MIDIARERLYPLSRIAKRVPRRRRGRKCATSTLYRWATRGLRGGIRLETLRVGGSLCTSMEALQRFFARLSMSSVAPAVDSSPRAEVVESELLARGYGHRAGANPERR